MVTILLGSRVILCLFYRRNCLDLYQTCFRKIRRFHTRSCRDFFTEVLCINFIYLPEICNIRKENRCLYDMVQIRTASFQNRLQILQTLYRLCLNSLRKCSVRRI